MSEPEFIWRVPETERLVALEYYRDKLYIATDQTIYRYDADKDAVEMVRFRRRGDLEHD